MREIKFRAKSLENIETSQDGIEVGDWVYGHYYYCRERVSGIVVTHLLAESGGVGGGIAQVEVKVDHKTVGQFVGLPDKNGKGIYGRDILKNIYFPLGARKEAEYYHYLEVKFLKNKAGFGFTQIASGRRFINLPEELKNNVFCEEYHKPCNEPYALGFSILGLNNLEIIGNTTDNQELLKGE